MYSLAENIKSKNIGNGTYVTPDVEGDFIIKFTNIGWSNSISIALNVDCDIENVINICDEREVEDYTKKRNTFIATGMLGVMFSKNNEFKKISNTEYEINNVYKTAYVIISVKDKSNIKWSFKVKGNKLVNYETFYRINQLDKIVNTIETIKSEKKGPDIKEVTEAKDKEIDQLKDQVKELESKIVSTESTYKVTIDKMNSTKDETVKELENKITQLEQDIKDGDEKANNLNKKIVDDKVRISKYFETEIEKLNKEKNDIVEKLKKDIEQLNEQIEHLTSEKKAAISEATRLQRIAESQKQTIEHKDDLIGILTKKEEDAKLEIETAKNEIKTSKETISKLELELKTLTTKINVLDESSQSEYSNLQNTLVEKEQEIAKLKSHVSDLEGTVAEKTNVIVDLEKDIATLNYQINCFRAQATKYKDQEKESEEKDKVIKQLRLSVTDLEKAVTESKTHVDTEKDKVIKQLRLSVIDLEKELQTNLENLKQISQQTSENVEEKDQQIEKLKQGINDSRNLILKATVDMDTKDQQIKKLEKDAKSGQELIKQIITSNKKSISSLKQENQEKDEMIKRLQRELKDHKKLLNNIIDSNNKTVYELEQKLENQQQHNENISLLVARGIQDVEKEVSLHFQTLQHDPLYM